MYRILVLDDEPYIVDWICGLIEDITEYEIDVYRTYTPDEALRLLDRAQIDIIISDIFMPGISGIDLLKKAKDNWPDSKFIMLTAYDNFDDAYQSIKNKAFGYVLKSEDDSVITNTILDALKETDKKVKSAVNSGLISEKQKEEFLLNVLFDSEYDKANIMEWFMQYRLDFELDGGFYILIGYLNEAGQNLACYLESQLSDFIMLGAAIGTKIFVWLMQPKFPPALFGPKMTGALESIQRIYSDRHNAELSFIYNTECFQIGRVAEAFNTLIAVLSEEKLDKSGFIISYSKDLPVRADSKTIAEAGEARHNYMVEFISRYIESNIENDLSLIMLSEVTGYNPSYLSRLFKETTGKTLSEYIASARIDKIRLLMQSGKMSLSDIAAKTGFHSRQYFNRFIKKTCNMTPNELYEKIRARG